MSIITTYCIITYDAGFCNNLLQIPQYSNKVPGIKKAGGFNHQPFENACLTTVKIERSVSLFGCLMYLCADSLWADGTVVYTNIVNQAREESAGSVVLIDSEI